MFVCFLFHLTWFCIGYVCTFVCWCFSRCVRGWGVWIVLGCGVTFQLRAMAVVFVVVRPVCSGLEWFANIGAQSLPFGYGSTRICDVLLCFQRDCRVWRLDRFEIGFGDRVFPTLVCRVSRLDIFRSQFGQFGRRTLACRILFLMRF